MKPIKFPVGVVDWSNIHTPNKKFIKSGEYSIQVNLEISEFQKIKESCEYILDEYIEALVNKGEIDEDQERTLIRAQIAKAENDRMVVRAKQKYNQNKVVILDSKGNKCPSLKKEFKQGELVRISGYPKPYYSKQNNTAGISFRINEITIVDGDTAKKITGLGKFKNISAKIPMELVAEFEKVKGEYFSVNYNSPKLSDIITKGMEQSILQMKKEIKDKG